MNQVEVALLGLGNVGQAFARYVLKPAARSPVAVLIRAVADSRGALVLRPNENLELLLDQKRAGRSIRDLAPGRVMEPADMIASLPRIGIPVLVEALPTNLVDGQPALELLASALAGGTRVVTVDKGPLVFGFEELTNAARAGRSRFAYSGTTGVSAPNQVAGERFVEIEGVLNGTTNFILTEMQESGARFELALERARSRGIAEPDPSLDIAGWDTACKILILAKTLMGAEAGLADVSPMGIGRETELLVEEARARGRVVRLIGRARVYEGKVRVAVAPELVAAESPFHSVTGTSKAAVFTTETKRAVVVHGRSGRDAIAQTILDDLIKLFS